MTCILDVMVMMQAVWELELTEMQETACNENECLSMYMHSSHNQ